MSNKIKSNTPLDSDSVNDNDSDIEQNTSKIDTKSTLADDDGTIKYDENGKSLENTDADITNGSKTTTTLDDIGDKPEITQEERIAAAMKNVIPDECKRDVALDKKIQNYGSGVAAVLFIVGVIISIFNMKAMKYPFSFIFMGLGGLAMCATSFLRVRNNMRCGCNICTTQAKSIKYSIILWLVVGIAGVIAGTVLTFI